MATWADYSLLEEKTNTDGEWLESALVEKDGLVLIIAGNHDSLGSFPIVEWEGVTAIELVNETSSPYEAGTYQETVGEYRYRNSGGRYWYYYTRTVSYQETNARLIMLMPKETGIIRAHAVGTGVSYLGMRVYQHHVTPSVGRTIKEISFAKSVTLPEVSGADAFFQCAIDEIIVAMCTDGSPNQALADIVFSGPAYQELWSKIITLSGFSVRIKVWRIKASGKATLTFQNASAGRMAEKFLPYVRESSISAPSPEEDRVYFEIQAEENANGHVTRPNWFTALYHTLRHSEICGLRKSWTRENTAIDVDTLGRLVDARFRRVEQWSIPVGSIGLIDVDESLIFEDRSEADDRITHMDNYW